MSNMAYNELGQIELYTHHPFLPTLVRNLQRLGLRTCGTYLIESQFMEDKYKFFRYAFFVRSSSICPSHLHPQRSFIRHVCHGEP